MTEVASGFRAITCRINVKYARYFFVFSDERKPVFGEHLIKKHLFLSELGLSVFWKKLQHRIGYSQSFIYDGDRLIDLLLRNNQWRGDKNEIPLGK